MFISLYFRDFNDEGFGTEVGHIIVDSYIICSH